MKRLLLLALLVGTANASEVYKVNGNTSVIINVCIASVADPNVYIHADEDIANLVVEFLDEDGVSLGLYDAGTEIEDVATPGTGAWTTPSANNVRVSPDGNGVDCTEIQPPDTIFASDDIVRLRISDGGTTLLDFDEQITLLATEISSRAGVQAELEEMKLHKLFLSSVSGVDITDNSAWACAFSDDATCDYDSYDNTTDSLEALSVILGTPSGANFSADLGAILGSADDNGIDTTSLLAQIGAAGAGLTDIPGLSAFNPVNTTIATLASQVSFTLTAGSTDDNAYNGCSAMITDQATATQIAFAAVRDYDGGTKRITMAYDPAIFTMAATDLISITCGAVMR